MTKRLRCTIDTTVILFQNPLAMRFKTLDIDVKSDIKSYIRNSKYYKLLTKYQKMQY